MTPLPEDPLFPSPPPKKQVWHTYHPPPCLKMDHDTQYISGLVTRVGAHSSTEHILSEPHGESQSRHNLVMSTLSTIWCDPNSHALSLLVLLLPLLAACPGVVMWSVSSLLHARYHPHPPPSFPRLFCQNLKHLRRGVFSPIKYGRKLPVLCAHVCTQNLKPISVPLPP